MTLSTVQPCLAIENLVTQIARDLAPWEKTARSVRYTLKNIKYQILNPVASSLDLFDWQGRIADGTVHYSGTGEMKETCALNRLAEHTNSLLPSDFPGSDEDLREYKRAVRLQLELFNIMGELVQAFKYEIKSINTSE